MTRPDRHHARILAMQALCQLDAQPDAAPNGTDAIFAESGADEPTGTYARALIDRASDMREHFRELMRSSKSAWDLDRMGMVERNVIRVAWVELTGGDVPAKVVLNEAIEIAREFGSAESGGFVNGVLDQLYRGTEPNSGSRLLG